MCEACGGSLTLLGALGSVLHLRCRDCGLDQQADIDDEE